MSEADSLDDEQGYYEAPRDHTSFRVSGELKACSCVEVKSMVLPGACQCAPGSTLASADTPSSRPAPGAARARRLARGLAKRACGALDPDPDRGERSDCPPARALPHGLTPHSAASPCPPTRRRLAPRTLSPAPAGLGVTWGTCLASQSGTHLTTWGALPAPVRRAGASPSRWPPLCPSEPRLTCRRPPRSFRRRS